MSVVVSDTSPLCALHHLGLVNIVPGLYGEVLVPPAVATELLNPPRRFPPVDVGTISGVRIVAPVSTARFASPALKLDPGETEALSLAVEVNAKIVLIDERRGRNAALRAGLQPVGVLGTLVEAKQAGLVSAIGPLMDQLRVEIGFFVSARVRARVLQMAGE